MKFKKAVALGLATMMIAGMATGCGDKEVQKPVEQQPVVEQPVEQEPVVQEPVVEARTAASANERLGMIIKDAIGESEMSIETTNENGVLDMIGLTEDMVDEYAVAYHPMTENYETVVVVKAKAIVDETATEVVEGEEAVVEEAVVEGETTEVTEEAVPQTEATAETTDAVAETTAAVTADTEAEAPAEEAVVEGEAVETTGEAEVTEEAVVETNEDEIIAAIKAFHASRCEAAKDTDAAAMVDGAVIFEENGYIGIVISADVANVHATLVNGLAAIEDIKIVPVVEEEVAVEGEATTEATEGETAENAEGTEEVENTEADNTDVNEAETSEEPTETTEETKAE